MFGYRLQAAAAAAMAALTVGASHAQCINLTTPGPEIRQFSREIRGTVKPGKSVLNPSASSVVFLKSCGVAGVPPLLSRQVNYGVIDVDFSVVTSCDQLPLLRGTLHGDYSSLTRLTDPLTPAALPQHVRIGRHNANGWVFDPSGAKIGTFRMNGTIGSVTSRAPTKFGVGPCYSCLHHEGLITISLQQSPVFVASATITATYQWDADPINYDCEGDKCLFAFSLLGAMDGMLEAPCGTVHM
ncbi:MAG TPA: hypothetical protein VGM37_16105 [Armatimonadota bacterium]|jgi:hypothetical protein